MSSDKHFKDMTSEEHRAWRAAWKEGKAERWYGSVAVAAQKEPVECHAPTEQLCVQLVQEALKTPLSWVVTAPKQITADALVRSVDSDESLRRLVEAAKKLTVLVPVNEGIQK